MNSQALFNRIVPMCGFSPLLGPGMVRRALKDANVDPATATAGDYLRAVPRLKARMRAYLPEEEVTLRAQRITQYLDPLSDGATSGPQLSGTSTESYRPPGLTESYRPPGLTDSYRPPAFTDSYRPPASADSYRPPAPSDSYRPPAPSDSYRPPISTDVYRSPQLAATARRR